ncbi:unnamed protein product, partial [Brenthis ino]
MTDIGDLLSCEDVEDYSEEEVADGDYYVSINRSGFRCFPLRSKILRAIIDCGFEHPLEVQHECLRQALRGMDILCQAKSGMELAFQISKEYERFSKYMIGIRVSVFSDEMPIQEDEDVLKTACPYIVVGTPGRILALVNSKKLNLKHLKHFILDECYKMLEPLDVRRDVQEIFRSTPHGKQVMMFSATLSKEIRPVCKKFMQYPMEVYVDDEAKLTLPGLLQYYVEVKEYKKNKELLDLLHMLSFQRMVIFVKSVQRCITLLQLLTERKIPAIGIHKNMTQDERLSLYQQFKDSQNSILVATNFFESEMDFERVDIVFNCDMLEDSDTFHQVARAGSFAVKGVVITMVSDENDDQDLK